jgi:hypothetical protein
MFHCKAVEIQAELVAPETDEEIFAHKDAIQVLARLVWQELYGLDAAPAAALGNQIRPEYSLIGGCHE